jgi:hypothetical protein
LTPGVVNVVSTLTPSPMRSPRRVPFRYVQISRQGTLHGVVDVNVIGTPTTYGPAQMTFL